jgi:hypothetical protein
MELRPELNPAQQDVVDLLGAPRTEWPVFDPELRKDLRTMLDDALAPVADELGDDTLWVSKFKLREVHGCEVRFVAEQEGFVPSAATARGTVTHKAIELTLNLPGDTPPLDLVDEAIARLQGSDAWLAEWLRTCDDAERAELRGEVNDLLVKFLDCWPPLRPQWRPAPESRLNYDLFGGTIVLAGKVDLALGRAEGTRAGKVLIDLKTGRASAIHREDLRFYALIEALRLGVPPRRVATHYLDSGHLAVEDVTVDLLEAAVARTVDGIEAMVELKDPQRQLVKKPGPACSWCALAEDCDEGQAWLTDDTRGGF